MDINNLSKRAQELWNEWEFRSLILLSLFLQTLLVVIGNRRKYSSGIGLAWFVWIAYLSADWVATLALGIASRSQGGLETNPTNPTPNLIPSFWAPILLVHLGGPDTITAYALEDNEMWLRHILQLAIQTAAASYFLFIYLAIPVFVAGITKYGERILALWQASSKKFRASEIGRNFNSELSKKFPSVGLYDMSIGDVKEGLEFNKIIPEAVYLHEAHFLFQMFKILFADLGLARGSCMVTRLWLPRTILRSISFLSSTSALVTFSLMIANKHAYPETEVIISYILLGGAVVPEIYGVIMLLLSEWAMLHLSMLSRPWADSVYRAVYSDSNKRWKRYMAQHDLTDARITKNGSLRTMVINSLACKPTAKACFMKLLGKDKIQSWELISDELKEKIWEYLLDKRLRYGHQMPHPDPGLNDMTEILAERGDQVLKSMGCSEELFHRSVVEIDFHGSLLLWHIGTDICYHDDICNNKVDANNQLCKRSRSLSNYMLYLLIERPNMLPKGISEEPIKQTCIQLTEFSWCWRSKIKTPTHWGSEEFMNEIKKTEGDVSMLQASKSPISGEARKEVDQRKKVEDDKSNMGGDVDLCSI
ncbi:hypothetical protein NC653_035765 [Populus alba x Populus x berolinensis]|uniref:DUF4220 domain-containing protein n=1 Tax=Populus alba x Populus x berolinensis TaxID=444605 RepID=A0AAD6PTX3_9ROSI|nr:uncharacterized protein LOC118035959 [Populus alba]KAJ6967642.1 hypothetical protein NC653_035765 [Populus alba x Populus x berolinensis]